MIVLRILMVLFLVIACVVLILLLCSFVHHEVRLQKEKKANPAPGTLVSVDGSTMHVFAQGEGNRTLVFLSGHGTTSPVLDFKPLWSHLTDTCKIVVVERPGYGWSGPARAPRHLDRMLQETRGALERAGHTPPYVLIPHSMAGLEALRWAKAYPAEVQGIVGLDPCVPDSVHTLPVMSGQQLDLMHRISRIGLTRFMPPAELHKSLPLLDSDRLSETDKRQYVALFHRQVVSTEMVDEYRHLKDNALEVAQMGVPTDIPMHVFLSTGQEVTAPGWIQACIGYLSSSSLASHQVLDATHYIHHALPDTVVSGIRRFLAQTKPGQPWQAH